MHTVTVLHKLLERSAPSIHAARLDAFLVAVQALVQGARASVTSLGRHLSGKAFAKHKIKRVDRLLSNAHIFGEVPEIYAALTQRLISGLVEPIIIIDWSPLCADQSWQLLRVALPVGGRTLTLYEEIHPQCKLGNRKIQHAFLDKFARMVPEQCRPIVVADSGFRTPFFRYIEKTLAWHWVGRIRGRDHLRWEDDKPWFSAKTLHDGATTTAKKLGLVQWVKNNPLSASIVLLRQPKKRRQSLTLKGEKRRSKVHNVHADREREPWLLVTSVSLQQRTPKQIVNIYRARMQIEEGFRDCKAVHYGFCLTQNRRMNKQRRTIMCLIAACALFVLWCVGLAGKETPMAKQVRVNSSSKRESYSVIFLAKLLIAQACFRITKNAADNALKQIRPYMESVLCG